MIECLNGLLGIVIIPYLVCGLLENTDHKDELDKLTEFDRQFHDDFIKPMNLN